MCVVSMVMDHFYEGWKYRQPQPWIVPMPVPFPGTTPISPAELDEFRRLLERAREYDKKMNQPDCELEEKRQKLLKLAGELGVNIDFV